VKVGSVKEIKKQEYRVGITPDNAAAYVHAGNEVYIEKCAGEGSGFTDEEYTAAGAKIVSADDIWEACDMVVKVKEPLEAEYAKMRKDQILYTYLHLAADRKLTEAMMASGINGVAYETVAIGRALPLLRPMSEIAGRLSIHAGIRFLEKPMGGMGVLLGGVPGVPRAKVVVIGAGVVGYNAAKMAVGLNADVTIIDVDINRLSYLEDIFGGRVQTLFSSPATIERELMDADLVVSSALIPGAGAPKLIKREYLKKMKKGAVIIDPAIDQGGTTDVSKVTYHDDPIFVVDDCIIYCVANMPGATPRTSTIALTNATLSYGLTIAKNGLEGACKIRPELVPGVNTYRGKLVCKPVADEFGLAYEEFTV
jgi:alanine dehydrogenase